MAKHRRQSSKQQLIFSEIRDMIVRGAMKPGSRLPNRVSFQQKFGVSSVTVQGAFDALADAGLVVSAGRRGTFVAERPPHLFNYGLVFSVARGHDGWSNFHSGLLHEAAVLSEQGGVTITPYFGVNNAGVSGGLDALLADVGEKRVAGLIVTSRDCFGGDVPPGLETAPAVMLNAPPFRPDIPVVRLGGPRGFAEPAVDYLLTRRKRILAFLLVTGMNPAREMEILNILHERGLPPHQHLIQCVSPAEARWAGNLARLFTRLGPGERPDGVVVMDDNLVEHFCAGLVAAGVRTPEDMEIVAHCNFPHPVPSVLPVVRLGYDLREVLKVCLETVAPSGTGGATPPHVVLRPVFEKDALARGTPWADAAR